MSRQNFETLLRLDEDPKRKELPAMFSWLSSQVEGYPETLNLKMDAHIQELGLCPEFEMEEANHPLAQEYHQGIAPERVKEIMRRGLRQAE